MEEIINKAAQNEAVKWDRVNPSDFVKSCNESRERQRQAEAIVLQRQSLQKNNGLVYVHRHS
jgi:hypothetical protein